LAVAAVLVEAVRPAPPPWGSFYDALDVEARDAPGILGGLALRIVEIRRNR